MLDRNRDTLPINVIATMRMSTNELVREIFGGEEEDKAAKKNAKKNLKKSMKKVRWSGRAAVESHGIV